MRATYDHVDASSLLLVVSISFSGGGWATFLQSFLRVLTHSVSFPFLMSSSIFCSASDSLKYHAQSACGRLLKDPLISVDVINVLYRGHQWGELILTSPLSPSRIPRGVFSFFARSFLGLGLLLFFSGVTDLPLFRFLYL